MSFERGDLHAIGRGFPPGLLGIGFTGASDGWIGAELLVRTEVMAPNGFLHAGAVVTLADSGCGIGCLRALPAGAAAFPTVQPKANFLGTARDGVISCRAQAIHQGRTTQLRDAKGRLQGDRKDALAITEHAIDPAAHGMMDSGAARLRLPSFRRRA